MERPSRATCRRAASCRPYALARARPRGAHQAGDHAPRGALGARGLRARHAARRERPRTLRPLVGTSLASAGGAVFNHLHERAFDATMRRTVNRPIPSGRVAPADGVRRRRRPRARRASACSARRPTGRRRRLALATVVLYVYVYTPLKRQTPLNTLVGTSPARFPRSAATSPPPALRRPRLGGFPAARVAGRCRTSSRSRGCTARTTRAAASRCRRATDETGTRTAPVVVGFTVLTVAASVLPVATNGSAGLRCLGARARRADFLLPSVGFLRASARTRMPRRVLKASVLYVMLLVPVLALFAWAG